MNACRVASLHDYLNYFVYRVIPFFYVRVRGCESGKCKLNININKLKIKLFISTDSNFNLQALRYLSITSSSSTFLYLAGNIAVNQR